MKSPTKNKIGLRTILQVFFFILIALIAINHVLEESGVEIIEFPVAERNKLVLKAPAVWESWIDKAGGEPARETMTDYQIMGLTTLTMAAFAANSAIFFNRKKS